MCAMVGGLSTSHRGFIAHRLTSSLEGHGEKYHHCGVAERIIVLTAARLRCLAQEVHGTCELLHRERRGILNYSSLPLVCMDSLTALEDSLEGQVVLSRGFVGRYIEMWPQRYLRLHLALSEEDWEEATESALSLFSSSVMVGAERLGQMSGDLVEFLKQGQQQQAQNGIVEVGMCGNETVAELTERYIQQSN